MTLGDLEDTFPNGFHDAVLCSFCVSLETGTAVLNLRVDVSETEEPEPKRKDVEIRLRGVRGFICDRSPFSTVLERPVTVSGFMPAKREFPDLELMSGEARRTLYSFFVVEWNAFIHIAADAACCVCANADGAS